jgi:hypothetical protein
MSNLATVIAIVPRLPPAIDGVGDYALNLARQLRKDFNIQTHFIVGNSTWQGAAEIEGFTISQIIDNSANILVNVLSNYHSSSPVLLHYVGYGYAKRGCPVWLVDGLQRWKSLYPKSNLVTMFHEISASGPPWTSAFWLSSLQKDLAARLTKLSDRCITSTQDYAEKLYKLAANQKFDIISLPVFCTIGELDYAPPLVNRTKRLVIFGHKNSRTQVYQECLTPLQQICQSLNIQEICDIGASTGLVLSDMIGIPCVEKGITEAAEISKIFKDSIVGFLNFPPPTYLAKSTIFAAFCAHGLIPCMVSGSKTPIDGLESGKHYFSTSNQISQISLEIGQQIANNAYNWYQNHSLSAQAKVFAICLNHQ